MATVAHIEHYAQYTLDMLLFLKEEDSGCREKPGAIPVSQTIAQGVLSLVFALLSPRWGILRQRANALSPQVSRGLRRLNIPYALR